MRSAQVRQLVRVPPRIVANHAGLIPAHLPLVPTRSPRRPVRCGMVPVSRPRPRTGALVGTPLPSRPVAGRICARASGCRICARASGWEPLMTLRTPNRARLTPGYVRSMSFRLARLGRRGLDEDRQFPSPARSGSPAARRPCRSHSAAFVPGVPGRAGSRGSGLDARKRVRNINPSGFTLPTHPGTAPETPTAESTCQESERVVV